MTTLLSFLAAIAILVFVHEMGHYLAARQCGVQVLRFSIGFGRTLLTWTSKRSGTEWVISAIPLGGYVRMKEESFEGKALAARSWIVFAGPLANLIFAALAYAALFSAGRDEPVPVIAAPAAASPAARAGFSAGDQILEVNGNPIRSFTDLRWRMAQTVVGEGATDAQLRVLTGSGREETRRLDFANTIEDSAQKADPASVINRLGLAPQSHGVRLVRLLPEGAAALAGLRQGDQILSIDDTPVGQPEEVITRVQASEGRPLVLVVSDGSTTERVTVRPVAGADGVHRMGAVVGGDFVMTRVADSPLQAIWRGTVRTWEMSILTFQALGRMIMGEISWRQISGPVAIADAAGQSAVSGLQAFIGFLALISISIAVLNLLPIPMLDGGHLLYYLWEFVRGSPLPAEVQDAGRKIGLALIMLLTAVALFNDFARFAGW
jgi:regulator of sigma E protease